MVPCEGDVDVRCGLVLSACPHLQHLHLTLDSHLYNPPPHGDTFALVPRLRSLHLELCDSETSEAEGVFNFETMMASLAPLTELSCTNIRYLDIPHLLHIASHCTLERLYIDSGDELMGDARWIGRKMKFPISAAADEKQLEEGVVGI